jgi:hypothetical protein
LIAQAGAHGAVHPVFDTLATTDDRRPTTDDRRPTTEKRGWVRGESERFDDSPEAVQTFLE